MLSVSNEHEQSANQWSIYEPLALW